jgi:hypothetical protein
LGRPERQLHFPSTPCRTMSTSKPIPIKHACGHTVEHRAWGKRVEWLATKPCPACAGIKLKISPLDQGASVGGDRNALSPGASAGEGACEHAGDNPPTLFPLPAAVKHKHPLRIVLPPELGLAETEYKFHPSRMWRFDYAWPSIKAALEVEGSPGRGRHTHAGGFERDVEKYNAATVLGWHVVRCVNKRSSITAACEALLAIWRAKTIGGRP